VKRDHTASGSKQAGSKKRGAGLVRVGLIWDDLAEGMPRLTPKCDPSPYFDSLRAALSVHLSGQPVGSSVTLEIRGKAWMPTGAFGDAARAELGQRIAAFVRDYRPTEVSEGATELTIDLAGLRSEKGRGSLTVDVRQAPDKSGDTSSPIARREKLGHPPQEVVETSLHGRFVSSPRELAHQRAALDQMVNAIAAEREEQPARLEPLLRDYLRNWDAEQQRLTRENKDRPADEIVQAKKQVVDYVNAALERLNLAIHRQGLACNLLVAVNERHRRGAFWLKPKGSGSPIAHKANLSDLFDFEAGEPQLANEAPRREALSEWHRREKARRKKSPRLRD
jgi:hypothetical protein